tara:strand:- start:2098 stop:2493 length:396 start_codon:yes stop_codon:yes gene_type:complete
MNKIPEDVVEHIISFACDRRGYNSIEYHKRVKDNEPRMKRIIVEIFTLEIIMNDFFKPSFYLRKSKRKDETKKFLESLKKGCPSIVYHTGKFKSDYEEYIAIQNYNYNYFNPERYVEYFKFKKDYYDHYHP